MVDSSDLALVLSEADDIAQSVSQKPTTAHAVLALFTVENPGPAAAQGAGRGRGPAPRPGEVRPHGAGRHPPRAARAGPGDRPGVRLARGGLPAPPHRRHPAAMRRSRAAGRHRARPHGGAQHRPLLLPQRPDARGKLRTPRRPLPGPPRAGCLPGRPPRVALLPEGSPRALVDSDGEALASLPAARSRPFAGRALRRRCSGSWRPPRGCPGSWTRTASRCSPQLGRNLTALAREGELDPVVGRAREIEEVIDILGKRRTNNPCLVGEPGVGKTAVVEGVAQQLARRAGGRWAKKVVVELSTADLARRHPAARLVLREAQRPQGRGAARRRAGWWSSSTRSTPWSAPGSTGEGAAGRGQRAEGARWRGASSPASAPPPTTSSASFIQADPALERRFTAGGGATSRPSPRPSTSSTGVHGPLRGAPPAALRARRRSRPPRRWPRAT